MNEKKGLICDPADVRAIAEVLRPLTKETQKYLGSTYNSLCLKVTLDKHFKPEQGGWNTLWSNMLFRAFYLFAPFDKDNKQHTTGYEATPIAPFQMRVDKPVPSPEYATMTTGGEGPYDVDLHCGTCQCRFSAGHPWVLYTTGDGERHYVAHGAEAKQLQDWKTLQPFFPDLNWVPQTPNCVWIDTGSDPAADCKHLVALTLVLQACLADREGITDFLPEATQKVVGRLVETAFRFHLFPELK